PLSGIIRPGKAETVSRKIKFPRDVQERRQQRTLCDLSRVHELRDREDLDRGSVFARQIGARHRGVGGTQIDPDAVPCFTGHISFYPSSISAGATMVRPVVTMGGSWTRDARQPGWRSVPRNGGCPVTFPTRWKAAASIC